MTIHSGGSLHSLSSQFQSHVRMILLGGLLSLWTCCPARAERITLQAQAGELTGEASKVARGTPEGGSVVSLAKTGQGVKFTALPAGNTLAIRYGSVSVGTISVA